MCLGHYAGAWTDYKCVPVTDAYFSKDKGFIHWRFVAIIIATHPLLFLSLSVFMI